VRRRASVHPIREIRSPGYGALSGACGAPACRWLMVGQARCGARAAPLRAPRADEVATLLARPTGSINTGSIHESRPIAPRITDTAGEGGGVKEENKSKGRKKGGRKRVDRSVEDSGRRGGKKTYEGMTKEWKGERSASQQFQSHRLVLTGDSNRPERSADDSSRSPTASQGPAARLRTSRVRLFNSCL